MQDYVMIKTSMNDSFFYQEIIKEKVKKPKYKGELTQADIVVKKKDILANDEFTLRLKLNPNNSKLIQVVKWEGKGCTISRAVIEEISSRLVGVPLTTLKQLDLVDILRPLGLEKITPSRFKCANIGWQIFQDALQKMTIINSN